MRVLWPETIVEIIGTMGNTHGVKVSPSPSRKNTPAIIQIDWLDRNPARPVAEEVLSVVLNAPLLETLPEAGEERLPWLSPLPG